MIECLRAPDQDAASLLSMRRFFLVLRRSAVHKKDHKARHASHAETIPNASSLNDSKPPFSADDRTGEEPKKTVEVDFCELADGTLAEMIEDPQDSSKSL